MASPQALLPKGWSTQAFLSAHRPEAGQARHAQGLQALLAKMRPIERVLMMDRLGVLPSGDAQLPSADVQSPGDGASASGTPPAITGYDPTLAGMGIKFASLGTNPMMSLASLGVSKALSLMGGGSLSADLGGTPTPVSYIGPPSLLGSLNPFSANFLSGAFPSALGIGANAGNPAFIGSAQVPSGYNTRGGEFEGLALRSTPFGLSFDFGGSPNMGFGVGVPGSTAFSNPASQGLGAFGEPTGYHTAGNPYGLPTDPNATDFGGPPAVPDGLPSNPADSNEGLGAPPGGPPSSSGDGPGGDGPGTVICTELRRQGLMDDVTWEADEKFGAQVDPQIKAGYLRWAPAVVRWMQRSPRMTRIVAALALPWAHEMARQMGVPGERGSLLGWGIMQVGIVGCRILGKGRTNGTRHAS